MKRSAAVVLVVAVALCAGCGGSGGSGAKRPAMTPEHTAGLRVAAGTEVTDFALRDQNGRLTRLSAQRGRFVFVAFLYTHCTDVCPLIADWLDAAARPHARDATVLAVSVDPEGDTPAAVRTFVRAHRLGPEFHWLTGSRSQLARVWQAYNVLVERRSPEQVAHAAPVFLLDRTGRVHLFYAPPQRAGSFRHDLRLLLSR
jgi:protein SCO1/2